MLSKIEIISENIETIFDIVIILIIIICTIYTTRKKKKNNNGEGGKYIDGKMYIDEQEGFVMENNIQKNVKKYRDIKGFIKSFFAIPFIIIGPILLGISLYEMINQWDTLSLSGLIIFFIILLLYVFTFIRIKKTLDKYENNFLYKVLYIIIKLFGAMVIGIVLYIIVSFISDTLNLNLGLFFIILVVAVLLFSYLKNEVLSTKGKSSKTGLDSELKDDEQIYDSKKSNERN